MGRRLSVWAIVSLLGVGVLFAAPAGKGKGKSGGSTPAPGVEDFKVEVFVLPEIPWRDVFVDPRVAMREKERRQKAIEKLDVVLKKVWETASGLIKLEGIMGRGGDLCAVINGHKYKKGDKVSSDKLVFVVDRVTKKKVILRCITPLKKYRKLYGLVLEKELPF